MRVLSLLVFGLTEDSLDARAPFYEFVVHFRFGGYPVFAGSHMLVKRVWDVLWVQILVMAVLTLSFLIFI